MIQTHDVTETSRAGKTSKRSKIYFLASVFFATKWEFHAIWFRLGSLETVKVRSRVIETARIQFAMVHQLGHDETFQRFSLEFWCGKFLFPVARLLLGNFQRLFNRTLNIHLPTSNYDRLTLPRLSILNYFVGCCQGREVTWSSHWTGEHAGEHLKFPERDFIYGRPVSIPSSVFTSSHFLFRRLLMMIFHDFVIFSNLPHSLPIQKLCSAYQLRNRWDLCLQFRPFKRRLFLCHPSSLKKSRRKLFRNPTFTCEKRMFANKHLGWI